MVAYKILGVTSATLLIQVLDSNHLGLEITRTNAILAAPNFVQGVLLVKLIRYQRPAVPGAGTQRTVGPFTFSDPGFVGDRAPGVNEMAPVSEMLFLYFRRYFTGLPIIYLCCFNDFPAEYRTQQLSDLGLDLRHLVSDSKIVIMWHTCFLELACRVLNFFLFVFVLSCHS